MRNITGNYVIRCFFVLFNHLVIKVCAKKEDNLEFLNMISVKSYFPRHTLKIYRICRNNHRTCIASGGTEGRAMVRGGGGPHQTGLLLRGVRRPRGRHQSAGC